MPHKYKYKGETNSRNIEDGIHFTTEVGTELPTSDSIPEPVYGFMVKWLENEKDFWSSLNAR